MPKMKTHSSAKKRFFITGTGKVMHGCARRRHKMSKRSSDMKRFTRKSAEMFSGDVSFVKKNFLPYGVR